MNRSPDEAYAAALSDLPGIGPATLRVELDRHGPRGAWDRVVRGQLVRRDRSGPSAGQMTLPVSGRTRPSWSDIARDLDPPDWWAPFSSRGVKATWPGSPEFPPALASDPQPPGVLFWRGSLAALDRPCVAIVGTRDATPDGRAVAYEMGRDLARAGICVVSGLALGIDGAAHTGALDWAGQDSPGAAVTVGVAASGVDLPYPRRHARLWGQVVEAGAVISETPPGRPAQAWRFPMRNRIIAGLARMVVVVESHARGGSLITVEAALERGVEVRVVPAPVHSPAGAGSNQLLYDGAGPVRNARDVLDGLGLVLPDHLSPSGSANHLTGTGSVRAARTGWSGRLDPGQVRLLDAVGWQPTSLNQVAIRTGDPIGPTARRLEELARLGLVRDDLGWWSRAR